MRRISEWSKGWILIVGFCVVIGGLLTSGWGQGDSGISSAFAAPPPQPGAPVTDLAGVTQNWDKALPAAERFVILAAFNNAAVRDNNTGLVWERTPSTVRLAQTFGDINDCHNRVIAGTMGWRLPSIAELTSLLDRSLPFPYLPAGVFSGINAADEFWSSTPGFNPSSPTQPHAWVMIIVAPLPPDHIANISPLTVTKRLWCVRGGMKAGS